MSIYFSNKIPATQDPDIRRFGMLPVHFYIPPPI